MNEIICRGQECFALPIRIGIEKQNYNQSQIACTLVGNTLSIF